MNTTILYVRIYRRDYYLTSWNGQSNCDSGYFRAGNDALFDRAPTYFNTEEGAVAAAEEQGFTVLSTA